MKLFSIKAIVIQGEWMVEFDPQDAGHPSVFHPTIHRALPVLDGLEVLWDKILFTLFTATV